MTLHILVRICVLAFFAYGSSAVSCGGHQAETCELCPSGNGPSWCNGDCGWKDNGCKLNKKQCGVAGGVASKCMDCPGTKAGCDSSDCVLITNHGANACRDVLSDLVRTASVHLNYFTLPVYEPAWWFQRVVPLASSEVTYFAMVGNAFGYGGIQQLRKDPSLPGRALFSIWDQGCDRDLNSQCDPSAVAATLVCGTGVTCTDFGGEGTGRKSYFDSTAFPKIGEEVFMVVHALDAPHNRIEYTGFVHSKAEGWRLLSRIAVNKGNSMWYLRNLYSFVEQWYPASTFDTRAALYGPAWMSSKEALDFQQVQSGTYSLGNVPENFERTDGFVKDGVLGLSTGGDTVSTNPDRSTFSYETAVKPAVLQDFQQRIPCLTAATTAAAFDFCFSQEITTSPTPTLTKAPTVAPLLPTKAPTKSPPLPVTEEEANEEEDVTASPTFSSTKNLTASPTFSPTEAPLQIILTAEVAFAEELADDVIAEVSGAIEEKIANDLSVPDDYVDAVMTKAASRARRLLNIVYDVVYDVEITISIPAAKVAEIAGGNKKIAEVSNPANSDTMADSFASSLGSIAELKRANGGVEVTVSVEVEVLNVPESLEDFFQSPTYSPQNCRDCSRARQLLFARIPPSPTSIPCCK